MEGPELGVDNHKKLNVINSELETLFAEWFQLMRPVKVFRLQGSFDNWNELNRSISPSDLERRMHQEG